MDQLMPLNKEFLSLPKVQLNLNFHQPTQNNKFQKYTNNNKAALKIDVGQNTTPRKKFMTFTEQKPNDVSLSLERPSILTQRKISINEIQQRNGQSTNRELNIDKMFLCKNILSQESNSLNLKNNQSFQSKVLELILDQKKEIHQKIKLSLNFPYLKKRAVSLSKKSNEKSDFSKGLYNLNRESFKNQFEGIKNNKSEGLYNLQIQTKQTRFLDQKPIKIYKGHSEKDMTEKLATSTDKDRAISVNVHTDIQEDQKIISTPLKKNKEIHKPKIIPKKPPVKMASINFPQYEEIYLQKRVETQSNETIETHNDNGDKIQIVKNVKSVQQEPFLPPINENLKYTLVLDLDETLIHFQEIGFMRQILVRPYVDQFLREMSKYFEIVIFTAGTEDYANWIIDQIDTNKYIKYRLFRQHTSPTKQNFFIKDIEKLGRPMSKIIIIDNIPQNYLMQPHNGIQIQSWFDDPRDRALLELIPFLKQIVEQNEDVRETLRRHQLQQS